MLADVTIFIRTLVELMSGVRSNPATVEMLVVKTALQLFSLSGDDFIKMAKPLTTKVNVSTCFWKTRKANCPLAVEDCSNGSLSRQNISRSCSL